MKLTFLGTRGYIDAKSRRHRRHSAALVADRDATIMIDCGSDWQGRVAELAPDALFVTHAHPDHAWGLEAGTARPVYATEDGWRDMADYPIPDRHVLRPRAPVHVGGLRVEAFPVVHSLRCPAVGYRIEATGAALFYVPDVVDIEQREEALCDIDLYVGDGATIRRGLVRRKGDRLFGHTTIRAQLGWCGDNGVPRALFTHCGSEIVAGDERRLGPLVRRLGRERGVTAAIAHDGEVVRIP